jgi:hypothetical protein
MMGVGDARRREILLRLDDILMTWVGYTWPYRVRTRVSEDRIGEIDSWCRCHCRDSYRHRDTEWAQDITATEWLFESERDAVLFALRFA